MKKNNSLNQ